MIRAALLFYLDDRNSRIFDCSSGRHSGSATFMHGNDSAVYDKAFKEYFGVDLAPRATGFPSI